jgi:CDP-diacylglycerol--glycerol-3-phosphate 3-phosphatidyltransferase
MKEFVLGLTLLRIILSPLIFIFAIFLESYWSALAAFLFAAITDYYDGLLARKYGVESRLGAILDPIADKVLIVFTIISVIVLTQNSFVAFMGALIIGREFWVSSLRELVGQSQNPNRMRVTFIAKTKTTFQFIALGMYILGEAADLAIISFLANFTFFLSALLAYKSAIDYTENVFRK